jgi:glycosyltransferase involved in cell wall biosynthesis
VPWELAELAAGLVQARHVPPPAGEVAFVYQRYSLNNLAGLLLARRWGVPFVLEANGSEAAWRRLWTSLRFPRLAAATERLLLTTADRVAVVSENAADDLRAAARLDGRLRVVPNGVEVERFWGAAAKDLPFEEDVFVVAFAGLFYPWHGARFLAEAFPMVLEQRPRARLLLVGDGEEAALIRFILERAGAGEHVLHTGLVPRADVPGYLAAADVLVSPHVRNDRFIGSPIKIWEYMASGRAIVATRVAQMGEVLRHRETALLVEPDDPAALAEAIVELHDDEGLRAALGAAAHEEAVREHSWDARLQAALAERP